MKNWTNDENGAFEFGDTVADVCRKLEYEAVCEQNLDRKNQHVFADGLAVAFWYDKDRLPHVAIARRDGKFASDAEISHIRQHLNVPPETSSSKRLTQNAKGQWFGICEFSWR